MCLLKIFWNVFPVVLSWLQPHNRDDSSFLFKINLVRKSASRHFTFVLNNCKFTLIWPDIVRLMIPESKYAVMCQHRVGTCISRPMPVRLWHNVAYAPHAHAPEVYWHRHHGDEISCRPFLYYWPFCLWTAASQHRGLVMLCESLLFSLLYAYIIHSVKSNFLGKIWSVATINRIASIIW